MIYLDHNATTPVLPPIVEAMLPYLTEHFGNPSSDHPTGRQARWAIDLARMQVATLIGSEPDEVVFTGGGTESSNLAIRGTTTGSPGRILTSTIEHPATIEPCRALEQRGWLVDRVDVDTDGRMSLDAAHDALRPDTVLATVMLANNETGTLQPIAALARAAHQVGAMVHTDAAQAVGKIPVSVVQLDVDLLTIAGHKLYAPKGVGALYIRRGTTIEPWIRGAGHERGLRPGTENVAGIVALGAACALAGATLVEESTRQRALRDHLHSCLANKVPGLALHGHPTERLPNTLNVRFPRTDGRRLLHATPSITASTGSACHDHGTQPSAVLTAMGISPDHARGAIRLSIGRSTTQDDVEQAASHLVRAWTEVTR